MLCLCLVGIEVLFLGVALIEIFRNDSLENICQSQGPQARCGLQTVYPWPPA